MRRHIVYPFNLCIDRSFLSLCITSAAVNIKEILRQTYQTYLSGQESIAAMAMGDLPDQVTQPDGISGMYGTISTFVSSRPAASK